VIEEIVTNGLMVVFSEWVPSPYFPSIMWGLHATYVYVFTGAFMYVEIITGLMKRDENE
jgi:hypothetical protein